MQDTPYPALPAKQTRWRWLRRRKMTWALIVWTTVMAVWVIGGASQAHGVPAACKTDRYLSPETCNNASDTGTAIGVGLVFVLWFIGFIVLSLVWFMTRPKNEVTS
jgi:hypothetical protein